MTDPISPLTEAERKLDFETKLNEMKEKLDNAIHEVATAANMVVGLADRQVSRGSVEYVIHEDDMKVLQDALDVWNAASRELLALAAKGG